MAQKSPKIERTRTVRVGATGHRLLNDQERISAGIETALRRIEELFPDSGLTLISALAEGADTLIAKHVLKRANARLIVPLPLLPEDYVQDFISRDAADTFRGLLARAHEVIKPPSTSAREHGYQAVGEFVLRNCDILLAVWDGQPPQGNGGTGYVVEAARALQLPLAWIRAGNRKQGTNEPTSLGEEQGRVEFERFEKLTRN